MVEVGAICVKLAGRDAGKVCVVISKVDANYVMIDGATRKRKCNISHLHFLDKSIKIGKTTSSSDVRILLVKEGFTLEEKKKTKDKKVKSEKPKKKRKVKAKKINVKNEVKKDSKVEIKKEAPKKVVKKTAKKESSKK